MTTCLDTPLFDQYLAFSEGHFTDPVQRMITAQKLFNQHIDTGLRGGCAGLKMFAKHVGGSRLHCGLPTCPSCWHMRWAKIVAAIEAADPDMFPFYYVRGTYPAEVGQEMDPDFLRQFRADSHTYHLLGYGVRFARTQCMDQLMWMYVGLFGANKVPAAYKTHHMDWMTKAPVHASHAVYGVQPIHRMAVTGRERLRLLEFVTPWWLGPVADLDILVRQLVPKLNTGGRCFKTSPRLLK